MDVPLLTGDLEASLDLSAVTKQEADLLLPGFDSGLDQGLHFWGTSFNFSKENNLPQWHKLTKAQSSLLGSGGRCNEMARP